MSLVQLISLWGTLVGVFFTVIATLEKSLIKRIKSISTNSGNDTKELAKLSLTAHWRLKQLQKSKVIEKTNDGEYHFDQDKYKNIIKKRVIGVVIFLILSIFLIVIFQ